MTAAFAAGADIAGFYRAWGADAVMRVANFPDTLLPFLQMENLAARDAAARHGCDALVEIGCYDGRALEVARAARLRYVGVDINPGAIETLRRRITDEGLADRARALHGNVLTSEEWAIEVVGERPLLLLPFNLIGNFTEPSHVFASLRRLGGVAVVSVFNDAIRTTAVRRAYYTACGISLTGESTGPYGGALFSGDSGFRSQSFSYSGLLRLLKHADVTLLDEISNSMGRCVTVAFS